MTYRRVILDSAEAERDEIIRFLITSTEAKHVAARFMDDLDRTIDLISELPTLYGLSRMPELAERGYHAAFVGSYVVLYTFSEDTVFIGHIFHQRQDYSHLV